MAESVKYMPQNYFRIDNIDDKTVNILVNSCGEAVSKEYFLTKMDAGRRDYYLMYMLSGKLEMTIDGKQGVFEGGCAVCISPNTPYAYTNSISPNETGRYRWIHFTGSGVDKILEACDIVPNEIMRVEIKEEIISLWEDLFYEFRNNSSRLDGVGAIILPYILMRLSKSRATVGNMSRKLDLSIRYIHTHLAESLSIEALSTMEFLSPSRYREVFKNVTGHSPSEYITLLRLRQAIELFLQGDVSIEEAALSVGYTDRLYFQRVFKKHMGITPGAYFKMMRGQ